MPMYMHPTSSGFRRIVPKALHRAGAHRCHHLPTRIDEPGRRTAYVGNGNLTTVTQTDTAISATGQPLSIDSPSPPDLPHDEEELAR